MSQLHGAPDLFVVVEVSTQYGKIIFRTTFAEQLVEIASISSFLAEVVLSNCQVHFSCSTESSIDGRK